VEETNSVGMKLRLIPPGEFIMGEKGYASSRPRPVRITRPFFMGALELTRKQYVAIIKDPTKIGKGEAAGDPELPLGSPNWDEAVAFCDALSAQPEERKAGRRYRLPTEAEWEYACRAGTTTRFHLGDSATAKDANFRFDNPAKLPLMKGGSFAANAWGLFDMHGNVREWCADWYDADYPAASPLSDPAGPPTGTLRVVRGGGVNDSKASAGYRHPFIPATKNGDLGFRVFCEIMPPELGSAFPPLDPLLK
jgi:formylglycine-generating enzyme required for sulfatase activity